MKITRQSSNGSLNSQSCSCSVQEHCSQGQLRSAEIKLIWHAAVLSSVLFLGQCVSLVGALDMTQDMLPDCISLALLGGVTQHFLHAPVLKITKNHIFLFMQMLSCPQRNFRMHPLLRQCTFQCALSSRQKRFRQKGFQPSENLQLAQRN